MTARAGFVSGTALALLMAAGYAYAAPTVSQTLPPQAKDMPLVLAQAAQEEETEEERRNREEQREEAPEADPQVVVPEEGRRHEDEREGGGTTRTLPRARTPGPQQRMGAGEDQVERADHRGQRPRALSAGARRAGSSSGRPPRRRTP